MKEATRFYSGLFGAQPTSVEKGYAKWQLDDPGVNYAISANSSLERTGLDHLGIQAETEDEFRVLARRLHTTSLEVEDQAKVHCCYAVSDKSNVVDPAGLSWEAFLTHGKSPHWETRLYGPKDGDQA